MLVVLLTGFVLYLKRENRGVRVIGVILLAFILFYCSLGALTAYRNVELPDDASREAWVNGCLALQDVMSRQYIPVVCIYGFGLVALALIPPRKKIASPRGAEAGDGSEESNG